MGKLVLIRHGEAFNQELGLLAGDREFPLTKMGNEQALSLSQNYRETLNNVDHFICSPIERCMSTIQPYLKDTDQSHKLSTDNRLREINVGDMYYEKYETVVGYDTKFYDFGYKSGEPFPKGESFVDFATRIKDLLSEVEGQNISFVTHAGVINVVLHIFYDIDFSNFPMFAIKNAHPYELNWKK